MFGRWCNGNTTGFGSVIPGSNPSRPTPHIAIPLNIRMVAIFILQNSREIPVIRA